MDSAEAISLFPLVYMGAVVMGGIFRFLVWSVRWLMSMI